MILWVRKFLALVLTLSYALIIWLPLPLLVMFQLSDLSGSRPSSWLSPRLSLPASHRDWQRSTHTDTYRTAYVYHPNDSCLQWVFISRSHSGRGWRQTRALWCHCVRRLTTISGLASTHYRWAAEPKSISLTLFEQLSSVPYYCCLRSSSIAAASSRWTSRPSRVSLWGRRTRTKACSTCGRKSSSCHVQNGTVWFFFLGAEIFSQKWPHSFLQLKF